MQKIEFTQAAGRYSFQREAEYLIAPDVATKLGIEQNHSILEIGCGPGNILCGLASISTNLCGIDSAGQLEIAAARPELKEAKFISGRFEDLDLTETFDRIVIYGVVQWLSDLRAVISFIKKAATLLNPEGKMLVGDLPNSDTKRLFLESDRGKKFQAEWSKIPKDMPTSENYIMAENIVGQFSNEQIAEIQTAFRSLGFLVYLLPQSPALPFGYTREDILISRP